MMTNEDIARIAHEVNRAWCEHNGDKSQPKWADAPDWQRISAINGVAFHRANPDAGDSASHDSWMREKVENGWIYGVIKDPDAKPPTHPASCPSMNFQSNSSSRIASSAQSFMRLSPPDISTQGAGLIH
jgi:hypothetical protein